MSRALQNVYKIKENEFTAVLPFLLTLLPSITFTKGENILGFIV